MNFYYYRIATQQLCNTIANSDSKVLEVDHLNQRIVYAVGKPPFANNRSITVSVPFKVVKFLPLSQTS